MKKRLKTLTILFIGIILISMVTAGCSRDSSSSDEGVYTSVSELSGKRIGVQMGSIFDSVSRENIPDAQIMYFSTFPDIVMALKSNKIDAFPNLRMVQTQYMHTDDSVTIIDEEIGRNPAGYVFPKMNGNVVGYETDIAYRFCKEYGYALDVVMMNFEALMPAVTAGKCDFAASGIAITEERAQSVYFSDPNIYDRIVVVVLKKDTGSGAFFHSMADSFRKTFIVESRYKLFLKGIAATLAINILSIIFGTLLGFAMYMACRNGNPLANKVIAFFVWLIRGMPAVVLLMLLYYVIFGKISISGLAVAVIAFTFTFGVSMYGMLVSGVKAVDPGQAKAGYALGFDDRSTFFHLILPQAAQHFMPAYRAEIVALIKASAIVGYIAVEDLTRMGDIIRSRTYEPFFPIISVAIIYFILAAILTAITDRVIRNIDPKKRTKEEILKGIEIHD